MNPIAKAIDCFSPVTAGSTKALKANGISAVGRYVGNGSKCLTPTEVSVLTAAGLSILSIFETNPTYRAYFARERGAFDAKVAVAAAQALGQPAGTPIYFTVDYDCQDADMPAIRDYFDGVKSAIGGYKVGIYGSYRAVSNVAADFYWQTMAWSYGKVSPRSAIYQSQCDTTLAGLRVDIDLIYKPCGWWPTPEESSMTYPKVNAQVNGKPYLAVAVKDEVYLVWTAARDLGLNITRVAFGDVEIDGKKPTQVTDGQNTYIRWSDISGLTPNKLADGSWNFTSQTHSYTLVVTEPEEQDTGTWAPIKIDTLCDGKPLGHQLIQIAINGFTVCKDFTDSVSGEYVWQITETNDKVDTVTVSWMDPDGKPHSVTNTTHFSVPQTTLAPIPSDDTVVAVVPIRVINDQILLDVQTVDGKTLHMQWDTGAQTVTMTAADAAIMGLSDPGGNADITVHGVTGDSKAYLVTGSLVLGGVRFDDVTIVVDGDFQGPSLFGYQAIADNHDDLLISQKHNSITILK